MLLKTGYQSKLSRRQRHSGRLLRPPLPGWWHVYTWGLYGYSKSRDREMTWINEELRARASFLYLLMSGWSSLCEVCLFGTT